MGRGPEKWPQAPFFFDYGAGPMLDLGPYYITTLVNMLGPAKRVTAFTKKFDDMRTGGPETQPPVYPINVTTHLTGVIEFECGALITMISSFDVWKHGHCPIEIYGSEGSLQVPDPNTFGGPVKLLRAGASAYEKVPVVYGYRENSRGLGVADLCVALREGRTPSLSVEDFPCFSHEATEGNQHVDPTYLDVVAKSLTADDAPTFERALRAMEEGDLAWLGFKIVYDADAAQRNTDNEVTKKYGDEGSADGEPLVFFCNDAKEIVASRPYSPRDTFQMKDVTRGPSMHNEQFEGLTWASVPLFDQVHVWLLGASDAASEVAALADHVGFAVTVVDYDPAYVSEARFPTAKRIVLEGGNFDALEQLDAAPEDYVCVLTRGHMFDPEGCVWATRHHVHYVGMMGCAGKNDRVRELVLASGATEEDWERVKRPIGLKFGAKTPAELAIAMQAAGEPRAMPLDYEDVNVGAKVVKLIQSYTPIVNETVWLKR